MELSKGWQLLMLLVGVWVVPVVSAAEMPRHIVFASDPQFPWTDNTDARLPESDSQKRERSRWLIETQYDSIADFRRQQGGSAAVPVMINGDMTAFGHADERSYIQQTLDSKLQGDYDYGLGNHDYQNNVDDCFLNNCAAGSIEDLKKRYWGKVGSMDLAARASGSSTIYYGSLAYSRDYGDVHLVQLHNEPTYSVTFSSGTFFSPKDFEITPALDWLERDLQQARAQGKIILLNMHKPNDFMGDWSQEKRFRDMIEKYEVTAIFAGHLHGHGGTIWYTNGVPGFISGSASQQTYLIASFSEDRKNLHVYAVDNNQWQKRELIATVPVS
ncbi:MULTISPECIES: metallophosphoesterase family protein [unclassified Pseudomonas]|jgi:cytolysin (calcineurin-like family phosphatase)|uniref:metallophosphoesterase family protein n=1 Tax=unclassified Pseudomonas TaxID=196821 RepID=UPI001CBB6091|nr:MULTISPECIES: metallophosphoesterase [unclassified Pseudomonas]